jgi:hypothetical protein
MDYPDDRRFTKIFVRGATYMTHTFKLTRINRSLLSCGLRLQSKRLTLADLYCRTLDTLHLGMVTQVMYHYCVQEFGECSPRHSLSFELIAVPDRRLLRPGREHLVLGPTCSWSRSLIMIVAGLWRVKSPSV